MSDSKLTVAPAPFVHCGNSIRSIMLDFSIALLPAAAVGVYRFGPKALCIISVCILAAVVADIVAQKLTGRQITTGDFHAVFLGFMMAMLLPATVPVWAAIIGVLFAIIIGKHFFGGIGTNPFNPVLLGWVVLDLSWHGEILRWVEPGMKSVNALVDYVEAPLEVLQRYSVVYTENITTTDLLLGAAPGPIGVAALAVIVGGIYLLVRGRISWKIPAGFIAGLYGFAWIYWSMDPSRYAHPAFHLFSGTAMLGAFFLATDYPASPVTCAGRIIYGIGCGAMVMIIRIFGIFPDGVPFAILFMSLWTPIFDRIRPKVIGVVKGVGAGV
ncbi:MAG: RnfABCDGE type electron transport complex subunit D [bacterium]